MHSEYIVSFNEIEAAHWVCRLRSFNDSDVSVCVYVCVLEDVKPITDLWLLEDTKFQLCSVFQVKKSTNSSKVFEIKTFKAIRFYTEPQGKLNNLYWLNVFMFIFLYLYMLKLFPPLRVYITVSLSIVFSI